MWRRRSSGGGWRGASAPSGRSPRCRPSAGARPRGAPPPRPPRAEGAAAPPPPPLSGGEARRVHLARALALKADALLLDEPFAGLDAPARAELLYDAASALRDGRRATLVVVHARAAAWALAARVVVLLEGAVAADGTPADVFGRPPTPAVAE